MDATQLRAVLDAHVLWLRGKGGERATLSRCDLSEANLSGCDLSRCDLSLCDLSEANLSGCDLSGCDLSGCDLSGCEGIIDAGQRCDSYRFVGWLKDNAVMIRAGCRNITLAEYREHNATRGDALLRAETAAILDRIEAGARARRWIGEGA
jgi:uncharacterized protein YjbI with pentapeptide repeats